MDLKRPFFLVILLTTVIDSNAWSFNPSEPEPAIGYIVSAIKHLEATVVGSFGCVFFRTSEVGGDDVIPDVLRAPELASISKFIISMDVGDEELNRLPEDNLLVAVEVRNFVKDFVRFRTVMRAFGPNSRMLVLLDTVSNDVQFFGLIVEQLMFCNVVYLDVKRKRMFAVDVIRKVRLGYLEDVSRLWNGDRMRNMRGRALTFISKGPVSAVRPAVKWLLETASVTNTTVRRSVQKCPTSSVTVIWDECYLEHFFKKNVDIDLQSYHVYGVGEATKYLFTGLTDTFVILVPRSQLTIIQLFTFPFDREVWILIGLILAAAELLRILFPSRFRNDPILLVVCGFERNDLHTAGRWEKVILLSVMQLIFFTTCAYETLLLAMMVAKPASQKINTIQEFINSGIKIKVNFLGHTHLNRSYPDLTHLMVNSSESILNMDTVHAHIVEREAAEYVLPRYYDPVQRLNRYSIIEETLGMAPQLYMINQRTPFKPALEITNAALIEAGILTHYWPMLLRLASTDRVQDLPEEAEEVLFFNDFTPAWIVLGVGLSLSCAVYGGEVFVKALMRMRGVKQVTQSEF